MRFAPQGDRLIHVVRLYLANGSNAEPARRLVLAAGP